MSELPMRRAFRYCDMKVLREMLFTPLTHAVVGWLKRVEDADTFDSATHFNPFSLRDEGDIAHYLGSENGSARTGDHACPESVMFIARVQHECRDFGNLGVSERLEKVSRHLAVIDCGRH